MWAGRQTDRQTDRQTERQSERETERARWTQGRTNGRTEGGTLRASTLRPQVHAQLHADVLGQVVAPLVRGAAGRFPPRRGAQRPLRARWPVAAGLTLVPQGIPMRATTTALLRTTCLIVSAMSVHVIVASVWPSLSFLGPSSVPSFRTSVPRSLSPSVVGCVGTKWHSYRSCANWPPNACTVAGRVQWQPPVPRDALHHTLIVARATDRPRPQRLLRHRMVLWQPRPPVP